VGQFDAQESAEDQDDLNRADAGMAASLEVGPPEVELHRWAKVAWTVEDVQLLFDISDEDAASFLARHESNLQERMTERGWDALETLGSMDRLPKVDEEDT
jgi:hypothetical protein